MGGLALAHIVGGLGPLRGPVGERDIEVRVFVVHREHAAAFMGEERHAVAVVAEGGLLARAGAARRMVECGATRPERIAPAGHHVPVEAVGNGDRVEAVGGDGREVEARHPGPRRKRCHAAGSHNERARAECSAAFQKAAPRERAVGPPFEIGG